MRIVAALLLFLSSVLFQIVTAPEAQAQAGQGCSIFSPCPSGYSCMPFRQVCHRDSGARAGEACQAGYGCGSGLTCEAGSQVCRGPSQVGQACHATRPCAAGLTCEAGSHVCRAPGTFGEACHITRPCGDGLFCQSFTQQCAPRTVSYASASPCGSLRVQATAEDAKRMGGTMAFGAGSSASKGRSVSFETGLVYGEDGQFGCYATACTGFESNMAIANYAGMAIGTSFDDFRGFSVVTSGGVDTPILQVGFETSQVWRATAPSRALRDAGDLIRDRLIGTASGFSFGVGLSPVTVGTAICYTAILDAGDPLGEFADIEDILTGWIEAGFAPEARPEALDHDTRRATLRGFHGDYLVAGSDGRADANAPQAGPDGTWQILDLNGGRLDSGDRIALLSRYDRYLVAEKEGGEANADRPRRGSWEVWQIALPGYVDGTAIEDGDGVTLKSAHGKYLVAEFDGRARADRPGVGEWEIWQIDLD